MKEYKLDARGLACPKPLLRTKQVISDQVFDSLTVLVSNEAARENVLRFLNHIGFQDISWKAGEAEGEFSISSKPGEKSLPEKTNPESRGTTIPERNPEPASGKTVLIASTRIGLGDDDLGRLLMKGYIYTLTQLETPPSCLIFMNAGVTLALDDSESLEDIKILEGKGVHVLVCGTCLDFLKVGDRLQTGQISNMYEIAEKLHAPAGVLTLT
ncbi:sulfurtransferase-like selenium metabolism protein YedF [Oceanispirochaeta crateris]|nr:sulfurtransferase-like selenium metabolism protein YedF [Oceanispirochaeta crateris]